MNAASTPTPTASTPATSAWDAAERIRHGLRALHRAAVPEMALAEALALQLQLDGLRDALDRVDGVIQFRQEGADA